MKRYENTRVKANVIRRGKASPQPQSTTSYESTVYSAIPQREGDIYVITQPGDRFDLLAAQFYGDPNLWWYIAKANGLKFMTIPVGTNLRIPKDTTFAIGK